MYGERYLLMTKIVKCKKYLFSSFSPGDLCPLPKKSRKTVETSSKDPFVTIKAIGETNGYKKGEQNQQGFTPFFL